MSGLGDLMRSLGKGIAMSSGRGIKNGFKKIDTSIEKGVKKATRKKKGK